MLRTFGQRLPPGSRVVLGSVAFDPLSADEATAMVRDSLARGAGGLMVVVGRDLYREGLEPILQAAQVVLAGSASVVWASRLAGRALPQQIRPAVLAEALCAVAAADGRRIFVVGGTPGAPGVPSGAQRAAAVLGLKFRGLRIAGSASPPADGTPAAWAQLCADVVEAKPDLVLVGTADAAQETVLAALRPQLPGSWLFASAGLIDVLLSGPTIGSRRPRTLRRSRTLPRLRPGPAGTAASHALRLLATAAAWLSGSPRRS